MIVSENWREVDIYETCHTCHMVLHMCDMGLLTCHIGKNVYNADVIMGQITISEKLTRSENQKSCVYYFSEFCTHLILT